MMGVMAILRQECEKFDCLRELAPPDFPAQPRPNAEEHDDEHHQSQFVIPRCGEMLGDCADGDCGGRKQPNSTLVGSGLSPSRLARSPTLTHGSREPPRQAQVLFELLEQNSRLSPLRSAAATVRSIPARYQMTVANRPLRSLKTGPRPRSLSARRHRIIAAHTYGDFQRLGIETQEKIQEPPGRNTLDGEPGNCARLSGNPLPVRCRRTRHSLLRETPSPVPCQNFSDCR
jgi:hypothetical protein